MARCITEVRKVCSDARTRRSRWGLLFITIARTAQLSCADCGHVSPWRADDLLRGFRFQHKYSCLSRPELFPRTTK